MRKEGPAYDLPIALGVLACIEMLPVQRLWKNGLVVGELSLDGSVRHVRGGAAYGGHRRVRRDIERILRAQGATRREAALIPDLEVIPVPNHWKNWPHTCRAADEVIAPQPPTPIRPADRPGR